MDFTVSNYEFPSFQQNAASSLRSIKQKQLPFFYGSIKHLTTTHSTDSSTTSMILKTKNKKHNRFNQNAQHIKQPMILLMIFTMIIIKQDITHNFRILCCLSFTEMLLLICLECVFVVV